MIKRIIGITVSILIHLMIFLLLFVSVQVVKNSKPQPSNTNNIEVTLLPPKDDVINSTKLDTGLSYATDSEFCKDKDGSYEGVGFIAMAGTGEIVYIPKFYPAYKAGLRLNDNVIDYALKNGYAVFDIRRGFEILKFRIKTEKICYQDKK